MTDHHDDDEGSTQVDAKEFEKRLQTLTKEREERAKNDIRRQVELARTKIEKADVELVMQELACDEKTATTALRECGGDLKTTLEKTIRFFPEFGIGKMGG